MNTCTSTRYLADCFVQESIKEDENGTVSYEFNTDTIDFLDQYKNLTLCIKPYTNDTYPDINREVKSSLLGSRDHPPLIRFWIELKLH